MKNFLKKIYPRFNIQGKLTIIFILLSTIPLLLLSIYTVNQQISVKQAENLREMESDIKGLKQRTSLFLTRIESEIQLVLKSTEFGKLLSNVVANKNIGSQLRQNAEEEFINIVKDSDFYLKLDLLNRRGKELISVINSDEPYAVNSDSLSAFPKNYYAAVVRGMEPGDINLSPAEIKLPKDENLTPVIDFVLPIFENKRVIAIVTANVRAQNLFELLLPSYGHKTKKVSIVNGEGYYIFHSDREDNWKSLFTERQNENLFMDYSEEIASQILSGNESVTLYYGDRIIQHAPIFTGSKAVTNRYFIIEDVDASSVFSSIEAQKNLLIIIIIAVVIISMIIGYLTASRFLKPIQQLILGTQIIRRGNLDHRIEVKTNDEVEDLVDNFNMLVAEWKNKQLLEKKVRRSEKLFYTLTQTATDAIIGIDQQGRITAWNNAATKIFGYTKEEAIGNDVFRLIVPESLRGKARVKLNEFLNSNNEISTGTTIEAIALKKDNLEFPAELSISSVIIEDKLYATGIVRDITERKKMVGELIEAKEKAEEMNRVKSSFLANMSHELRTPMIGIIGYTEILGEELDDPEHLEMISGINLSGQRLLNTLNMLLDLSRIESKEDDLILQKLNLVEIIKPIVNTFENAATEKGLSLEVNLNAPNASAMLEVNLFSSIINNLLNNAVKFTNKGGIKVVVEEENEKSTHWVVIKIIDTGIGIDKQFLDVIFKEFRQASEGFSRTFEGTGLGLTITKKSVELMNGFIIVESTPGEGSIFTIKFPAI